jgi:hypothetical protein
MSPGDILPWAGGAVAVLASAGYAVWLARVRRQRRAFASEGTLKFIGGACFFTTRDRFQGAESNFTSPMAQLEILDTGVRLSLQGFARWGRNLLRTRPPEVTELGSDEIERVERFGGTFGLSSGIRFRTVGAGDERDGIVFWPRRRDRAQIVSALSTLGLPVEPGLTKPGKR